MQLEMEFQVKYKIKDAGLEKNFHFVGKIVNRDLPQYYQTHDILIHMSNTGSLDKVLLEAMACGLITFAYNSGGPKETIENGKTGFLYNSIDELVEKNAKTEDLHDFLQNKIPNFSNEQKKFWQYYDLLFIRQLLDDASLANYAKESGLDETKFNLCLQEQKYDKGITVDLSDAAELGLRGTPTYFVNGKVVEGFKSIVEWDKIILSFLNK